MLRDGLWEAGLAASRESVLQRAAAGGPRDNFEADDGLEEVFAIKAAGGNRQHETAGY